MPMPSEQRSLREGPPSLNKVSLSYEEKLDVASAVASLSTSADTNELDAKKLCKVLRTRLPAYLPPPPYRPTYLPTYLPRL